MSALRVLPADVYDALELSAEAYDGIGAGRYGMGSLGVLAIERGESTPVCVIGHAYGLHDSVREALRRVGITTDTNDEAVRDINYRRFPTNLSESRNQRVPFADWCAALGVERGA